MSSDNKNTLSIHGENIAYYDKKLSKILYHFSKKKFTISVSETVECIRITDTHIYFILDGQLVFGVLDQTSEFKFMENPFKNTDEKPIGIIFLDKANLKVLFVISNLKHAVYYDGKNWIDISPVEGENIVEELPSYDFSETPTLLINMETFGYYGIFLNGEMKYKKIAVPEDHMVDAALSETKAFYLSFVNDSYTEIKEMKFSNSGVFTTLLPELKNKIFFTQVYNYKKTLYILAPRHLFIFPEDKPYKYVNLDEYLLDKEDDGFVFMTGHEDNILIKSCKGCIIKIKISEDIFDFFIIQK